MASVGAAEDGHHKPAVRLVLLDLRKHMSAGSICTGSSRLFNARLGDKFSDKLRLRHWLARGVRPSCATTCFVGKSSDAVRPPGWRDLVAVGWAYLNLRAECDDTSGHG